MLHLASCVGDNQVVRRGDRCWKEHLLKCGQSGLNDLFLPSSNFQNTSATTYIATQKSSLSLKKCVLWISPGEGTIQDILKDNPQAFRASITHTHTHTHIHT